MGPRSTFALKRKIALNLRPHRNRRKARPFLLAHSGCSGRVYLLSFPKAPRVWRVHAYACVCARVLPQNWPRWATPRPSHGKSEHEARLKPPAGSHPCGRASPSRPGSAARNRRWPPAPPPARSPSRPQPLPPAAPPARAPFCTSAAFLRGRFPRGLGPGPETPPGPRGALARVPRCRARDSASDPVLVPLGMSRFCVCHYSWVKNWPLRQNALQLINLGSIVTNTRISFRVQQ